MLMLARVWTLILWMVGLALAQSNGVTVYDLDAQMSTVRARQDVNTSRIDDISRRVGGNESAINSLFLKTAELEAKVAAIQGGISSLQWLVGIFGTLLAGLNGYTILLQGGSIRKKNGGNGP